MKRSAMGLVLFVSLCALGALGFAWLRGEPELRAKVLRKTGPSAQPVLEPLLFFPSEADTPSSLKVKLDSVARGLTQPTDLVFLPQQPDALLALEQPGRVVHMKLGDDKPQPWFEVQVESSTMEEGLLGVALHPKFGENGRFFLNFTRSKKGGDRYSVVDEWRADPKAPLKEAPAHVREIMRVDQPFVNHNGGCLRFGPDGMLYIGWGDGGAGGDPHGNGQSGKTWLGAMLRIDIDGEEPPRAYRIPQDNPFRERSDVLPEIFALGVRNPWRYTFAPDGRLVVADVGQNLWEEIGYALPGDNLGWRIMEGRDCYEAETCEQEGLRLPFHVYGHDLGQSLTGGEVVLAEGPLRGRYVFGDYVSGRLWALTLPKDPHTLVKATSLGQWPLNPSTFGRDSQGRVYVADRERGLVYRIVPEGQTR